MQFYRNLSLARLTNPVLCFASLAAEEHVSQGDLTAENRFRGSAEVDEVVQIQQILQVHLIRNYSEPTSSPVPLLVRNRRGYFCIDGWNLIEQARRDGLDSIGCRVQYLADASDIELAILKVAVRSGNRRGKASYAEEIANVKNLKHILMEAIENPVIYAHGGLRTSDGTGGNRSDDVVRVIANRLGKDRSTITDCLNKSAYLTDGLLVRLVADNTKKRFFESLSRYRRRIITTIKSQRGIDPHEIEESVSSALTEMVETYLRDGMQAFRNTAERLITEAIANATSVTITVTNTQYENLGGPDATPQSGGNSIVPQESPQTPVAILRESSSQPEMTAECPLQAIATDSTLNVPEGPTSEQARARFKNVCIDMVSKIESMTDRQLFDEASKLQSDIVRFRRDIMIHLRQVGEQVEGGQS
jgi:hypothetical protein